jgi:hypothetical protein
MAVASPAAADSDQQRAFVAFLKGANEVPAVETDAFGVSTLGVDRAETAIKFALVTVGLKDIVQAHIHCGAPGVNGPVVAFLFGPADPAVTKNGLLSHGAITDEEVIPRPDSAACPGGVANFDDLLAQIRAGNAYVNVHTTANPGGEIRGQLK